MESSVLCDDRPFGAGDLIMPCAYSSHPYHIALFSIGNRHFVYGNKFFLAFGNFYIWILRCVFSVFSEAVRGARARLPAFIFSRQPVARHMVVLYEHLVGQQKDFVAENAVLIFLRPENPAHADRREIPEREIGHPHIFAQIVAYRIAEIFHHFDIGFLCGSLVEFTVFIEHFFCKFHIFLILIEIALPGYFRLIFHRAISSRRICARHNRHTSAQRHNRACNNLYFMEFIIHKYYLFTTWKSKGRGLVSLGLYSGRASAFLNILAAFWASLITSLIPTL